MSKKKDKRKAPPRGYGTPATPERKQHQGGVLEEFIDEKNDGKTYIRCHRARFECILDAYLWHGHIGPAAFEAGMKFRREYQRAVLKIRVYDSAGSHGDVEMFALSAINSNQILQQAYALLPPFQRAVVVSVCGDNNRAGTMRRIKYLRRALEILARHWRLLDG